jgi:hypothetical protein
MIRAWIELPPKSDKLYTLMHACCVADKGADPASRTITAPPALPSIGLASLANLRCSTPSSASTPFFSHFSFANSVSVNYVYGSWSKRSHWCHVFNHFSCSPRCGLRPTQATYPPMLLSLVLKLNIQCSLVVTPPDFAGFLHSWNLF